MVFTKRFRKGIVLKNLKATILTQKVWDVLIRAARGPPAGGTDGEEGVKRIGIKRNISKKTQGG